MSDHRDDEAPRGNRTQPTEAAGRKPISMHEGVPAWHDVCCCEAEPRWIAVAEELGIDLDAGWKRDCG